MKALRSSSRLWRLFGAAHIRARQLVVCLLSVPLAACTIPAVETPRGQMCEFQRYRLEVGLPGEDESISTANAEGAAQTVAAAIHNSYREAPPPEAIGAPDDAMLFISGGGQHGAFGAGVLDEWKQEAGHLPRFRLVTGISTGAILSTFAFTGHPERLVRLETDVGGLAHSYAIRSESELLRPIVRGGVDHLNLGSGLRLARHGAVADLDPLRQMLRREIDDSVLREVADNSMGRLLLVGAVDVDTGQAVAFDLTDMARKYRDARDPQVQTRYHDCYVEAIIASASVPLGAAPAFIDNRMYVDGGARFGLFSSEVGRAIERRTKDDADAQAVLHLGASTAYAIVNGDLTVSDTCGRRDPSLCGSNDPAAPFGAHTGWNLLDLADRSEQVLANQIYRMSLDRIMLLSDKKGRHPYPAWIRSDAETFQFTMDDPQLDSGRLSCHDWRMRDSVPQRPIQFYPRYMHCLIGYGRAQYHDLLQWHHPQPAVPEVAAPATKP